ncbi:MAG: ribonuclease J [Oscillospiraceae bacterium]|nr:ribonuclease J [Oscillospiraceae bacterium]
MGLLSNNKLLTETENISKKQSRPAAKAPTQTVPKSSYRNTPPMSPKKYRHTGAPVLTNSKQQPMPKTPVLTNTRAPASLKTPVLGRTNPRPAEKKPRESRSTPVKFMALGGLNEIGKNLYVYECSNDMFIVDCGLAFPDEEMLGVDLVVPDFTYLEKNKEHFRGIVITHGHEDHIGALPYLLKKINVPIYGTRLTLGLVEGKLKEHGLLSQASLNVVEPRQNVRMGCMSVEFIRVNHSIPDSCALAIHTPAGVIVHTGDFKVDYTPIEGGIIDLARFGELGNRGVLALMSESTNVERSGYTKSERSVGESFKGLFAKAEGKRIIIATFSSNIHRIQQIIDEAVKHGRHVAVSGRSMTNVIAKAVELNYIKVPDGTMIDIEDVNRYDPSELVIATTGSQGEPLSALSRMSSGDHRQVTITPNDFIIISANPIPGNEKLVTKVVNELMKQGAEVIYESMYEVHVSGHACQEELKMMISLTKPKFFVPIHGEYKHMKKHVQLATGMGIPEDNTFIADLGDVLETDGVEMKFTGTVPSGKVMVDGFGVGDVGSVVLRDRKHLAEDGVMIIVATMNRETGSVVAGPDIVSRGFVYVRESEELLDEAKKLMTQVMDDLHERNVREWGNIKSAMRDALSEFIYKETKRSPMILPIIMEI